MNKIEKLIKEKCPNGVKLYKIKEIANITIGEFVHKNKQSNDGLYPVFNGGTSNTGFYDEYNNDGHKVIISARGANAGFVNRVEGKYWAGNSCYSININDESTIEWNYLYQYLKNYQSTLLGVQQTGSIPAISKKQVEEFKIAIPPIEVQKEIVRILDQFGKLEAELEAELEARKSQYNYWRKKLLSNNKNMIPIKDVLLSHCSGSTPLKSNNEYYDNGTIPWLRTQEVKFNEIYNTECFVTETALKKTGIKYIPENCVIVAMSGATAGRCAINKIPLTTNQHCLNLEANPQKANYKYLYYCICNSNGELLSRKEGARGDLNSSKVLNLKINLPSLTEQNRIVNILDRFDKLVNSITEGLPAEIEARRKQYEYYRNKLLNFEEVSCE